MNHPAGLVRKHTLQMAATAMNTSAKSCCRTRQGELRSGARSCHFLRRPLFMQMPVLTLFGAAYRLLFDVKQQRAGHWPIANVNQDQRLDQTRFWPRGAATCRQRAFRSLLTLHNEPRSRTRITTGGSDRVP
uniref:Uncharacterized protein n=1 Tax=Rhipicephalus zambeziensis TaxID=60191 RepID=A0A224Y7P1_9ACAR